MTFCFRFAYIFLSILFAPIPSYAAYPELNREYLNDFAEVLDLESQKLISNRLYEIKAVNGIEIKVVIIKKYANYETGSKTWEEFSTGLFNYWQIGTQPINKGVLLLVSTEDRKIRIELGAGYFSSYDKKMKSIIDNFISPDLKRNRFLEGILNGVNEITTTVTSNLSFFERHVWYFIAGGVVLISCFFAFLVTRMENPPVIFIILGLLGFILYGFGRGDGNGKPYGGGGSGGGGASGGF